MGSKDKEPEQVKRQRFGKNVKSKDNNVFAALCTTLSQAVLPGNKTGSMVNATSRTADEHKSSGEENHQENDCAVSRGCPDNSISSDENHVENELAASRSCSELLHGTSENRQLGGEDCALIPPKSSPEMAVNGS